MPWSGSTLLKQNQREWRRRVLRKMAGWSIEAREARPRQGRELGASWGEEGGAGWNFLGASSFLRDGEAELGEGSRCPLLAVE
jgi:hypothetical protein